MARRLWSAAGKVARSASAASMEGKTVIITGANSGLGRATAAELLRQHARVIMACRDRGRAEEAARELRAELGLCSRGGGECRGELLVRELDLASLRSVRSFCQQVLQVNKCRGGGGRCCCWGAVIGRVGGGGMCEQRVLLRTSRLLE